MKFTTGGAVDFHKGSQLASKLELPTLCVEHWLFEPGPQPDLNTECTTVAFLLSGRSGLRHDDGTARKFAAQPGMAWVCPVGTRDSNVEFMVAMEALHIYLPAPLLGFRALQDYEIDPSRIELAYATGVSDPVLQQIASALKDFAGHPLQGADRLFVDGMQTALVGHLLSKYSIDRWRRPTQLPMLDAKRLTRVLDFIEARLNADLVLEDLAAEACLSAFHFSRLFRQATGVPPHRYLTERRVEAAKEKLGFMHSSLAEIALDTGFGSQATFTRVFRKTTGLTPGQYRSLKNK